MEEYFEMFIKVAYWSVLIGLPIILHLLINEKLFAPVSLNDHFPHKKWFGPGDRPIKEDDSIKPFKVNISEEVLDDLKSRIASDLNRLTEPLIGTAFHFGFNTKALRPLLEYWRDDYDWKKTEQKLNQFPQFKVIN